ASQCSATHFRVSGEQAAGPIRLTGRVSYREDSRRDSHAGAVITCVENREKPEPRAAGQLEEFNSFKFIPDGQRVAIVCQYHPPARAALEFTGHKQLSTPLASRTVSRVNNEASPAFA